MVERNSEDVEVPVRFLDEALLEVKQSLLLDFRWDYA